MKKKVLIVDDEPDVLMVMSAIVKVIGYDVLTASNALEGISICRKEKPELVLMDVHMPGMDGLEACRIIRADEDLKATIVVFVTASTSEIEKKKKEAGAQDYVIKPFQTKVLSTVVRRALGDEKIEDDLNEHGK